METKVSRIFAFENGTRIDLKKVVCIGALDKDQYYNIFIPVYIEGCEKPIKFVCCNAIGKVSPEQKEKTNIMYNHLINEWEQFKMQEHEK